MELMIKRFDALTVDELYEILRLRMDVFVVEQTCPYPDIDGRDPVALHIFLRDDGGMIQAYLRLLPPGQTFETVSMGRVIARQRRQGLGSKIVAAGIQAALMFLPSKLKPMPASCTSSLASGRPLKSFWKTASPTFRCGWI